MTPDTPHRADVGAMREAYDRNDAGLREELLPPHWLAQFERWLADAVAAPLPEPNAMIVASADGEGRPSARTVLLKDVTTDGFTFFTNYTSRKGTELAANPATSLVFPWFAMHRQVVVCGRAEPVERAVTEAYFAGRPRESQLGAWASPQSQIVPSRAVLDDALAETERQFAGVPDIPPPPYWGGILIRPETVEFWHGRTGRLHDRLRYYQVDAAWRIERLGP